MSLANLPGFNDTSRSRLQSLYSDFSRQKSSNPNSYHANVEWWRRALDALVWDGLQTGETDAGASRLVLAANIPLINQFKVEGVGKPLAIGAVVTELQRTRKLILLSQFLNAKVSIHDPGWLPTRVLSYIVGKPFWWALGQMGVTDDEVMTSGNAWWGEYVVVDLVERASHTVLAAHRAQYSGPGDALYSLESFKKRFSSSVGEGGSRLLGDADVKILLRYLERDRRAIVTDGEIIKFLDATTPAEMREINAVDRAIVELKTAVGNVHSQIDGIQDKIDGCTKKATNALRQKRQPLALSYIRSRKQLDDLLKKRLINLETLETTLIKVVEATGNIELMQVYESSTTTLRSILAHPSLQRDKIDDTMNALAEANADAKEIDDAVRIGGDIAVGVDDIVDDSELESELQVLVAEVDKDREIEEKLAALDLNGKVHGESPKADLSRESKRQAEPLRRPLPS